MNEQGQKLLGKIRQSLECADRKLITALEISNNIFAVEARDYINDAMRILHEFDCEHCEGTGKTRLLDLEIP